MQLLLLVLISTSENSKKDVWEIWYEKRVELRCLFGEFLVNTNSIVIIIVVLGILFMVGFWLLMLSQNLLWTPVFSSYFLSDVRLLFFSLTHKRCFNNFFVMLVCLLLFRRYRLCLFCFFFLESVAGGEKEVYLSNLVVAVKWHLSLCVCIPLKVYICVIPKKKSRYMNITLILLYTMDNNKKLGSEFQRFFIFFIF